MILNPRAIKGLPGLRKSPFGYGIPCRTADDAGNGLQLMAPKHPARGYKGGAFQFFKVK